MRTLIFTLGLIFIASISFSQAQAPKMELKSTGFVGPDSNSHYIVIDAPNINQVELYKNLNVFERPVQKPR
jgi:hypothetical protein